MKKSHQLSADGLVAVHVGDVLEHRLPVQLELEVVLRVVLRRDLVQPGADAKNVKLPALGTLSDGVELGQLRIVILELGKEALDGRVVMVVAEIDAGFVGLKNQRVACHD